MKNHHNWVLAALLPTAALLVTGLATTGCNQLLKASGAPIVTRADIRIVNDSPMKVCKVRAKDGSDAVVEDNALAGGAIGIKPGDHGTAQVDDRVGAVTLEIFGCDDFGKETLLQTAQADTAAPSEIRVR